MTAVRKGADFFLFQLMLLLCAIWGSQQVAIKLAADDIAPMLQVALRSGIAALLVGLLVSIFQAATQLNEATLQFVPKLVVMFIVLLLFGPWMLQYLMDYIQRLFESIPQLIG